MKEYTVCLRTCGGNLSQKAFTNKRKAKSFAFNWINKKKRQHRDMCNDRDYGELMARIMVYPGCVDSCDYVAIYY